MTAIHVTQSAIPSEVADEPVTAIVWPDDLVEHVARAHAGTVADRTGGALSDNAARAYAGAFLDALTTYPRAQSSWTLITETGTVFYVGPREQALALHQPGMTLTATLWLPLGEQPIGDVPA